MDPCFSLTSFCRCWNKLFWLRNPSLALLIESLSKWILWRKNSNSELPSNFIPPSVNGYLKWYGSAWAFCGNWSSRSSSFCNWRRKFSTGEHDRCWVRRDFPLVVLLLLFILDADELFNLENNFFRLRPGWFTLLLFSDESSLWFLASLRSLKDVSKSWMRRRGWGFVRAVSVGDGRLLFEVGGLRNGEFRGVLKLIE